MKFRGPYGLIAVLLLLACPTFALNLPTTNFITTSFDAEAAADGNMFDITTFDNDITITSISVNISNSFKPIQISTFTKTGTFREFEHIENAWTLITQTTVIPSELNTPTIVDLDDFPISSNTTIGMYITVTNTGPGEPQMHYIVGNHAFSNDNLKLTLGIGIGGFFGYSIEDRTWSGTIHYTVHPNP